MDKGTLIILNGGSSAGKSTLGEALQDSFEEPYLLLGIDAFYRAIPPSQKNHDRVDPVWYSTQSTIEDGLEYFRLIPGPILDRVMLGRYRAVAQLLELGLNVISDEVIWKREWLVNALRTFETYRVFFVGVFVSDDEAERRHVSRAAGRLGSGWYRGSARCAHEDAIYDLKIDTTEESPEVCARRIREAVSSGLRPTAFEELRARLVTG
jgi:chloramphenicol 3-O phosphotransferase